MTWDWDYQAECEKWEWHIPAYYNVGYDCVDKHVSVGKKDKVALYWENEAGEERRFTFGDMKALSNRFGNVLRGLGLRKGDRFLLRIPNLPEFQVAFIGGLKIGAVPVPSSVMFKAHEIAYRINDSGASAIITVPQYAAEVEEVRGGCRSLKHIIVVGEPEKGQQSFWGLMERASEKLRVAATRADDLALICYTSGTTGSPKGAAHAHRYVIGNDPASHYWQALKEDDIVSHASDLSWIYTVGQAFLFPWRQGASVFLYQGRFNPEKWFHLLEKYRVTSLAAVPTAYRMMATVNGVEGKYDLRALRHCISAGEPLNPELFREWKERFGHELYDGLGMTEVNVYISNMKGMPIQPGSCGKPMPGHICTITNEDGQELSPGGTGIVAVKADDPGVFLGYWNKPEETASLYKNGWLLTGDICLKADDGYYWFQGRDDDLIMSSGYRISPLEVESAVAKHPAVLESAAVASPDPVRGVIVKSFVVLRGGYEPGPSLVKEIQEFVKGHIAAYKYPRAIEFVTELPKTQSDKIMRKLLREAEINKAESHPSL